jgi:hypothetical protein
MGGFFAEKQKNLSVFLVASFPENGKFSRIDIGATSASHGGQIYKN